MTKLRARDGGLWRRACEPSLLDILVYGALGCARRNP
jgi:hypothetical protein